MRLAGIAWPAFITKNMVDHRLQRDGLAGKRMRGFVQWSLDNAGFNRRSSLLDVQVRSSGSFFPRGVLACGFPLRGSCRRHFRTRLKLLPATLAPGSERFCCIMRWVRTCRSRAVILTLPHLTVGARFDLLRHKVRLEAAALVDGTQRSDKRSLNIGLRNNRTVDKSGEEITLAAHHSFAKAQ